MMEMVEAEENLFFRFHLDLQNFAQTLDLGRALGHAVEYGQHGSTTWVNQMFMKKKGDRFIFPALLLGILRENKSVLAPPACASSVRQ